jgi:hypothetical protein
MRRITTLRPSPVIVVAILALVAAMAGTAIAGSDVQSSAVSKKSVKKIAKKQAKKQIDKATLFAKVDQAGAVLASSGVESVTKTAKGDYLVQVQQDITPCANVASIRNVVGNEFHGLISTYTPAANTVRVVTLNRQGQRTDGNGFNLVVTC